AGPGPGHGAGVRRPAVAGTTGLGHRPGGGRGPPSANRPCAPHFTFGSLRIAPPGFGARLGHVPRGGGTGPGTPSPGRSLRQRPLPPHAAAHRPRYRRAMATTPRRSRRALGSPLLPSRVDGGPLA